VRLSHPTAKGTMGRHQEPIREDKIKISLFPPCYSIFSRFTNSHSFGALPTCKRVRGRMGGIVDTKVRERLARLGGTEG
jgi:hypothetical protein